MSPVTVIFVGLSGVGKSTLIENLKRSLDFQHLSAGSIIRSERTLVETEASRDTLRLRDIDENQRLLIDGFHRARDTSRSLIVLDGHTVIDTPTGLRPIPDTVFEQLGIHLFIYVKASPEDIQERRLMDKTRERPGLSLEEISSQQEMAKVLTEQIARRLSVSYREAVTSNLKEISDIINVMLD